MKFLDSLFTYQNGAELVGLTNELNSFCVYEYFQKNHKDVLVLTNTLYEANQYYDLLITLTDDVLLFPMDDFITSVAVAISPELKVKRLETLHTLLEGHPHIVVTNLMGLLRFLPDSKNASKLEVTLKKNSSIQRDKLIQILEEFGYQRDTTVSRTGEYAVRGYILDVFPIEEFHPIRIEFFGNEIDSIRYFDENTQLSINEITEITCLPMQEIHTSHQSSLLNYLENPFIFQIEDTNIQAGYQKLLTEITEYNASQEENKKHMFLWEELPIKETMYLDTFQSHSKDSYNYETKTIENFHSDFELLYQFVNQKVKDNYQVILCVSSQNQIKLLTELFPSIHLLKDETSPLGSINLLQKKLDHGFMVDKYCVISEYDIELTHKKEVKYRNSYKIGKKIHDFNQLQVGDYVVHAAHGIGLYKGVVTLTRNGIVKDYLYIQYAGNDKIYVPVEKIGAIFKYSSKDDNPPKLNKLSSTSWVKTKRSMQKRVHDISLELIKLYALRSAMKGDIYPRDPMEDLFDSQFTYEATRDQNRAFLDVQHDLESAVPMDRLLCGDVGFGKTEVAFRAMFKTAIHGAQVAYLCPTTILSKQQYENAKERFKEFPLEIALLNRFTSKKETNEILQKLKEGKIDIVFGTHRLLSDDVSYKHLGLLVVDEEQRFGVTHKEKIKQYKNDVNVLTLSATPIPRTLKMAISGMRDLSIIDTPPVNRYPIQTYVIQEQDVLIKDAIYKEMAQKGQVFILYNRVDGLETKKEHLQRLVPEARIAVAHGQMDKNELEDIMNDFINYEYDILLCTTIIETGIDIPNANTLIIYNADCFGLSQLYQIRGRVGRSNRIAYAYLLFDSHKMLNDVAVKRLQAIKEFTELGSGYRIAMRDLSLRGAGDILGSDQAGFVDEVGLDLYMKMIEDEVKRIKGEEVQEDSDSNVSLIQVDTHIDDSYVSQEELKIEIHKKINEIDSYEKLREIHNELEDRFGKVSPELEVYMYEEWFEKLAASLHIKRVVQNERMIELELPPELVNQIKFDKLFLEAYNINNSYQFRNINHKVYITLPIKKGGKHFIYDIVNLVNKIYEETKEG